MEIVDRILGKIVGAELSDEEMESVSGGMVDYCTQIGGYATVDEGAGVARCDN